MSSDYAVETDTSRMIIESIAGLLGHTPKSTSAPKPSKQPQNTKTQQSPQTQPTSSSENNALMKRGWLFLKDSDWKQANDYFNKVLYTDPKYAPAYIGLLCAELKVDAEANLVNHNQPLENMPNYKKALRFGDANCQARMTGYNQVIIDRIKKQGPTVGGTIKFNNYNWRVLEVQNSNALIITENVIEKRPYNIQSTDITCETSTQRKYLNSEFFQKFTNEEQNRITGRKQKNTLKTNQQE